MSRDLNELQAQKIEKNSDRTEKQRYQLEKYQISKNYSLEGEEITPEVVKAHRKRADPALKLQFWLTIGRQHLVAKDRAEIAKYKEKNNGLTFADDLNLNRQFSLLS